MAVLPFRNFSGDPAQDYLALGIAEQLTTTLGQVPWFFVAAQPASFSAEFGETKKTDIGQRLGVRYLIDGLLQRAGAQLRISVRLIETTQGQQIWSKAFAGAEGEIFELQDSLAETVIGEIEPRMRQIEVRRCQSKHGNLNSCDWYPPALPLVHGIRTTTRVSHLPIRSSTRARTGRARLLPEACSS